VTRHLAILRGAAWLVPCPQRAEWLREWTSELWFVCRSDGQANATAFCLGAFKDALWLRRNGPRSEGSKKPLLESPVSCILFLAVLAAASSFLPFRFPHTGFRGAPLPGAKLIIGHLGMILIALLALPATTSLRLGDYPANSHSPPWATRVRRWLFFALKIALISQIIFCAAVSLMLIGAWIIYLLAFRWALIDQRQRCPVCLRSLTKPTQIGWPSQTFLEWYGTELMCEKGHGLLYVPEIPSSCYNTQRWLYLDPSWSGLFL
jgi:hypothetical protein